MEPETKVCQNCKSSFSIDASDFAFYEKISVPPPTFCFDCRVQRRMAFRNERVLYKRECQAPGHSEQMISVFSPDKPQRVYCHSAWWGDSWDALSYGREVDFSRPFLAQLKELWAEVPDISVLNINPVNSEYCSITEGNKNCYLVFGGDFNEDTLYSTYTFRSKDCLDTYWVQRSEQNYETVDCTACTRLMYSRYCEGCYDSAFLFNCRNCHDCVGSVNLTNGAYQIFNKQYSKEDYAAKLKELNLNSYTAVQALKQRFAEHMLTYPRRFAKMIHSVNSSGDNLENCRNCRHCFDIFEGAEDCTDVFLSYSKLSDSRDVDRVGMGTESGYECSTIYPGSRVFFSRFTFGSQDVYYSYNNHNSANLFGCVGLRNKKCCILNKEYDPEDYKELKQKIIQQMNDMPYIDRKGRVYKYGEFFPAELSPFGYNETLATEMFPLTKDKAIEAGYVWKDAEVRDYVPTKQAADLPDRAEDVPDSITEEIIACEHNGNCEDQCTRAFRIVPAELSFYRRMGVPLPRLCSSCRHFARIRQRNPIKLYHRRCMCIGNKLQTPSTKSQISTNIESVKFQTEYKNLAQHAHGDGPCLNEFETTYAPDRPEIVYCEACYQSEVA